jgi:hypothetical protein
LHEADECKNEEEIVVDDGVSSTDYWAFRNKDCSEAVATVF